jgi:hypothetical protein
MIHARYERKHSLLRMSYVAIEVSVAKRVMSYVAIEVSVAKRVSHRSILGVQKCKESQDV